MKVKHEVSFKTTHCVLHHASFRNNCKVYVTKGKIVGCHLINPDLLDLMYRLTGQLLQVLLDAVQNAPISDSKVPLPETVSSVVMSV
jgi:hypothetical protein